MILAQDLGMEELKVACEDYVVSTLSVSNACTYLAAVLDIQEKSSSKFIFFYFLKKYGCFDIQFVAGCYLMFNIKIYRKI